MSAAFSLPSGDDSPQHGPPSSSPSHPRTSPLADASTPVVRLPELAVVITPDGSGGWALVDSAGTYGAHMCERAKAVWPDPPIPGFDRVEYKRCRTGAFVNPAGTDEIILISRLDLTVVNTAGTDGKSAGQVVKILKAYDPNGTIFELPEGVLLSGPPSGISVGEPEPEDDDSGFDFNAFALAALEEGPPGADEEPPVEARAAEPTHALAPEPAAPVLRTPAAARPPSPAARQSGAEQAAALEPAAGGAPLGIARPAPVDYAPRAPERARPEPAAPARPAQAPTQRTAPKSPLDTAGEAALRELLEDAATRASWPLALLKLAHERAAGAGRESENRLLGTLIRQIADPATANIPENTRATVRAFLGDIAAPPEKGLLGRLGRSPVERARDTLRDFARSLVHEEAPAIEKPLAVVSGTKLPSVDEILATLQPFSGDAKGDKPGRIAAQKALDAAPAAIQQALKISVGGAARKATPDVASARKLADLTKELLEAGTIVSDDRLKQQIRGRMSQAEQRVRSWERRVQTAKDSEKKDTK